MPGFSEGGLSVMVWSRLTAIFRKLFFSRSTSSRKDPGLSVEIAPDEEFTRFIFSKNHFALQKGRVKPNALMPMFNRESGRLETSIYRCTRLPGMEIWHIGRAHAEDPQSGRLIKARGFGPFDLVTSQELSLDVNGEPFPIHVDIVGWPEEKDARMMKATEVADKLKLELAPVE
jgi:hypothetical protein